MNPLFAPTIPVTQSSPTSGLNATPPLADIITPDSVSIWPLAMGWYLLAVTIIVLLTVLWISYRRYQKKWRYRKQALDNCEIALRQWQNQASSTSQTNHVLLSVLKRTAMTAYSSYAVDNLYGQAWLALLQIQAPKIKTNEQLQRFIAEDQYKCLDSIDPNKLHQFCCEWIKKHHTRWQGAQPC